MKPSFEEAVLPHYETWLKVATKLCYGNVHLAEDMLQESMVKALENYDKYDDTFGIGTWVTQILRRTVMDYYKTERNRIARDEAHYVAKTIVDEFPGDKPLLERLGEIILDLGDDDRQLVNLVLSGEGVGQIATTMGVGRHVIYARLKEINEVIYTQLQLDGYVNA